MSESEPRKVHILIADPQAAQRELLSVMLTEQGYGVQTATTSRLALKAAQESAPDLILLNTAFSGMDSYEICERLKADENTRDIPIIHVLPRAELHDRSRVFAAGASDYVTAPLQEEEVLSRVQIHLALRAMQNQLADRDVQLEQARAERMRAESEKDAAQELLREAELTGHDLLENLSDVIYMVDRNGILTYVSPAIESFLGYSPPEVIDRHFSKFIHPEHLSRLEEDFQRVLSGQQMTSEYRVVTKSGQVSWMRTSGQPAYEGNQLIGVQGVLADVTKRKTAEEQLRKQNEFLTSVLESLTHPFYVLDAHDYTVRMANSAARFGRLTGQTTCYILTHGRSTPCDTASHPCPVEQIKRTKKPMTAEHIHYDKEGQARNVEVHGYPLFDQDGNVVQIIEYALDITERKQAEEALQKLAHDLDERVKELNCLYGISAVVEKPGITLAEILQETVNLMPPSWQYPEITCARIILEDQEFHTENFRETAWQQTSAIWVHGGRAGSVQVCYLEERGESDEGPFLEEERHLINAIAQRLGKIVERVRAEAALKLNEERYALAQLAANIGSWDWDIRTGDLYWSDEIEPMFGFGPGEFDATYEAFLQCVHPDDRQYVVDSINACVQEGADYAIEHRIVLPTGTVRWMSETGGVIRDENGKAIRMLGIVQDITERRRAEQALQKSEALLTETQRMAKVGGWELNLDSSEVTWTEEVYRIHEVPPDFEPMLENALAFYDPGDRPVLEQAIQRATETGEPWDLELRFITARGNPLWVRAIGKAERHDGRVVRLSGTFQDITDRKQAEQALRESEARWRSVTETSPDHVMLLDRDLVIEFVNYASPGLTVEELIGTPLYTYVLEERQAEIKQILENVRDTTEPCRYETEFSTPDGSVIYYESRVVPRIIDDQVVGLAVTARDITLHKQAEQALQEAKEVAEQARLEEWERRQEADKRRQIAESLADVLAALNSNQPLDQVLDFIALQARNLLGNHAVAIYRLEDTTGTLTLQGAKGLPARCIAGTDTPPGLRTLRQAIGTRQPVLVPDVANSLPEGAPLALDTEGSVAEATGSMFCRAFLAVPIVVQDEAYGGILLYYAEPRSFSGDELELAAVFGDQVALAIENARLREQVKQAAATAERGRLARDLHDSVTQALFSASLVAEVLPQVWQRDPEEAQHGLEELRHLTRGALAEMRTLLLELRPTALLETRLDDLLRQLTEAITSQAQLPATLCIEPSPMLPPDVHVTFYRVTQEALHNSVKHASANRVTVCLQASPPPGPDRGDDWQGQIVLRVTDDGQGFDPGQRDPDHLGLGIMRERAASVGARLAIESQPGQGTQVILVWQNTP